MTGLSRSSCQKFDYFQGRPLGRRDLERCASDSRTLLHGLTFDSKPYFLAMPATTIMTKSKIKARLARGSTGVVLGLSLIVSTAAPAAANPFSSLFKGLYRTIKGSTVGVLETAWRNPVSTFELLNARVFKIKGTEKYLKQYKKYSKYLQYVPGIPGGGGPIPPGLVIDIAAKQAGILPNGLPRDLNSVLDEILGPEKYATANGAGACPAGQSTTYCQRLGNLQRALSKTEQAQQEAVIATSNGAGVPDPYTVRSAIYRAAKQGFSDDKILTNPIAASVSAGNESDRKIVRAYSQATLGERGQQNVSDKIAAIQAGLEGVNETAKVGLEADNTQDVVKAMLASNAQVAGFLGMLATNDERNTVTDALKLNQMANQSQAQDAIRRERDAEVTAQSYRALVRARTSSILTRRPKK